ncbi:hypothetical protein KC678_02350 [Candidatus Dojkabacteria bacterium]|uniref:Uncharacterized protein n=1 Tax=Candidatus Dojkabacteria bacterium TaxID=2099670 RepID=A0A955L1N6_9BACT|nr:hypothetical protein [Candidatus Dojkabacteria bacterium]
MILSTIFGLVLLLLFIFSLISGKLGLNNSGGNAQKETYIDLNLETPIVEVLPVEFTNKIVDEDHSLEIGQSYSLNSRFATTEGTNLICADESRDCEFYEVITNAGHTYYISKKSPIRLETTLGQVKDTKLGEVTMQSEELELSNSEGNVSRQMWGCLNESYCVSSGELYIDDFQTNQEEKNLFMTFVNSLRSS